MPQPAAPTARSFATRVIAPVVAIGAASVFLIAYLLWAAYGAALQRAEIDTLNYAKVLETRVDATVRRVDGVLTTTTQQVPEKAFAPDAERQFPQINASLNAQVTNFPETLSSRIFDATGKLRYSSGAMPNPPISISDRDWFQQALLAPVGTTVISQTIIGRISKEPTIAVARALRNENGKVFAIAIVGLSLKEFQKQFESLNMGPGGTISLRRADNHTLLVRWPHLPDEVNVPLKATNPVLQGIQAGQGPFNVQITAQTDGMKRIYGVDDSPGSPFYLVVGITQESALAPWRQQAITVGVVSVLMLAVVLFALWRLWIKEAQRLLAQSALAQSEAQLRNLMQNFSVGVVVHGPDTQIVFHNKTAMALLGLSAEQMLGKVALDPAWYFVREDGTPMPVAEYPVTRVIATREPVHDLVLGIVRPLTHDCVWVLVNAYPEFAANGPLQQVVVTFVDITENKQAATKLVAQEHYLSSIINNIGDPVFVKDEQSRFVLANDAFCSLFRLPRSRILGTTLAEDMLVQQMDGYLRVDRQVLGDGQESFIEELVTVPGGATLTVQTRKTRYTDESGKHLLVGVVRDISERKQIEVSLKAAKEAADSANLAKSQFLATMSHEIRTPLNVMKGMAYALRRTGLAPKQEECLAHIDGAAAHLLTIVSDVLDIAKIEAGKFELQHAEINVEQIAAEAVDMLRGNAHQKNIKLAIDMQAAISPLLGDATRLRQALLNYLSNALKFTEEGTITLRVRAEQESESHALLRFEVQDTGIGISPDTAARLFTPFEQADNSDTRQHGGTGLGLVITKRIAELMGGSAGVESTIGVGSTFWFTARLETPTHRPVVATMAGPAKAQMSPEQMLQSYFAGTRILLAEDDPTTRMIFLDLLEELGLVVDTATDGTFAVDKAANQAYALIVMDMQMPKMSGLEATRLIRATDAGKHVPIIMLTGNVFEETKTLCADAGANDFINKPVEPEDLFALILKWLTSPHGPTQLGS